MGFLNEEGEPYECPETFDKELVDRIKENYQSLVDAERVRVTVEVNEERDEQRSEFPTLVDIEPLRKRYLFGCSYKVSCG